jgi:hypothetical protein
MRYRLRTLLLLITIVGMLFGYCRFYLESSTPFTDKRGLASVRVYETAWQAILFKPAAQLESIVRGRPVYTAVWTSKESLQYKWL